MRKRLSRQAALSRSRGYRISKHIAVQKDIGSVTCNGAYPFEPEPAVNDQALVHSLDVLHLGVTSEHRQRQRFSDIHQVVVNLLVHARSLQRWFLSVDSYFPTQIELSTSSLCRAWRHISTVINTPRYGVSA